MITLRALTKDYGSVRAVDGLTFDIEPGRVTGFLGPNGAGKSTTMRLVLGLDTPTAGSALIRGRRYAELSEPLREMGALLDAGAMHPGRTGRAHLRVGALSNGLPARRVDEVLDLVGLGAAVARRRIKTYSLGMRQRLGIAAALLGDPRVLLFDEPINGLDVDGVRWLRDLLRRLADDGRTVLVSSHLMSEMELVADHVVIIGRGRLIADARLDELLSTLGGRRVLVTTPTPDALVRALSGRDVRTERPSAEQVQVHGLDAAEVGRLVHELDIPVSHLAAVHQSLEEAYERLTRGSVEHRGGAATGQRAMSGEAR
jgi:ABC-2 type transport system ATP-binding protein